jgi:hypothetical protein
MPKVTIVIGLPGSGKSEHLKPARQRGEPLFDDFHREAINNSHAFEKSTHRDSLKAALVAGKDCVIADIVYCRSGNLNEARSGINRISREIGTTVTIELLFFANDPAACKANVLRRNRAGLAKELAMIDELTGVYFIPPGAQTLAVWKPQ